MIYNYYKITSMYIFIGMSVRVFYFNHIHIIQVFDVQIGSVHGAMVWGA